MTDMKPTLADRMDWDPDTLIFRDKDGKRIYPAVDRGTSVNHQESTLIADHDPSQPRIPGGTPEGGEFRGYGHPGASGKWQHPKGHEGGQVSAPISKYQLGT